MLRLEQLINDYVKCWIPLRQKYFGIFEENDFGCENLQIIRNGFNPEDFNHSELCQLATLLTRELRGQINWDHKSFWAWCAFLAIHFDRDVSLFSDKDCQSGFKDLVNLVLSSQRRSAAGEYPRLWTRALRYVNNHLLQTWENKWQIAGPLTFSVLEGLLRRKNKDYLNKDGSVKRCFSISDPQKGTKVFDPNGHNTRLNRIDESIRCFEELVTIDRERSCPHLEQMKIEIASLYPPSGSDVYDMIDVWRNDLIHGKEYWQNRVPVLINLICLLVIDEIEPAFYDSQIADLKGIVEFRSKIRKNRRARGDSAPWLLFPPDI